jgi:hypothetical protein
MAADDHVERAIQALLDGVSLPGEVPESLCVVDAIARVPPDRDLRRRTSSWIGPSPRAGATWRSAAKSARGAGGTVYRAWDPKLAREVALKLLAPDALDSTGRTRRRPAPRPAQSSAHRPCVRRREHDGASGLWMELLEGETLDEALARDGVFGP